MQMMISVFRTKFHYIINRMGHCPLLGLECEMVKHTTQQSALPPARLSLIATTKVKSVTQSLPHSG